MTVSYSSNNSGGGWWLNDEDWHALEAAGWKVNWAKDRERKTFVDKDGRWLGALATTATREGLSLADAIEEWEGATGEDSAALGCSCCGPPHSFSFSGPNGEYEYYSPSYPSSGERYQS